MSNYPDHVFLFVDINGTITFGDTTKSCNALMSEVAGDIVDIWRDDLPVMSYKKFIQEYEIVGNKYDPEVRSRQEAKIDAFLDYLKTTKSHLYDEAKQLYDDLATQYINPDTNEVEFYIFPSFLKLYHALSKHCSVSIILRTFGHDGGVIIRKFMDYGIVIQESNIVITSDGVYTGTEEMSYDDLLTLMMSRNILIQDRIDRWKNTKLAVDGKLIPYVSDGNFNGKRVVSIFLDDNFKGDELHSNIAYPLEIHNYNPSWNDNGIIGVRVDTIGAAVDKIYFINKVNSEMKKRGYKEI